MPNIVAAIAVRLDANAVIRALEMDALGADILCTPGDFAAHREAVSVQKSAVGNRNIATGSSGPGELIAPDLIAMLSSPTSAKT